MALRLCVITCVHATTRFSIYWRQASDICIQANAHDIRTGPISSSRGHHGVIFLAMCLQRREQIMQQLSRLDTIQWTILT